MLNHFIVGIWTFALIASNFVTANEISCAADQANPERPNLRRITDQDLPNTILVADQIFSGGQPNGAAGFKALRRLGVKTAISVDGITPQFELANRFGIRYIHLPHGYSGISDRRAMELSKAVRDSQRPIYIHCHHGKHRSPAASAVATIGLGLVSRSTGREILEQAGTSKHYRGLFAAVDSVKPFDRQLLDDLQVDFQQAVQLPPVAEAMVQFEKNVDRLKLIAKSSWQAPKEHPDLLPRHEALMLRERLVEFGRHVTADQESPEYRQLVEEGIAAVRELEKSLDAREQNGAEKRCNQSFSRVLQNCQKCHRKFRDNSPL